MSSDPSPAERLRMLEELDVDAARAMMPYPQRRTMSNLGLLVGLHKASIHTEALGREYRQRSLSWLRANGYSDLYGAPLPASIDEL